MRSPIHIALDIVIAIMSVLTIGSAVFMINMFIEDWNYSYDKESFYYCLENENFDALAEMYYMNETSGVRADQELEQYYGVAKYFEAASYYKAYQDVGDEAQMKKYGKRMEEAKKQMGSLDIVTNKICDKLGI